MKEGLVVDVKGSVKVKGACILTFLGSYPNRYVTVESEARTPSKTTARDLGFRPMWRVS